MPDKPIVALLEDDPDALLAMQALCGQRGIVVVPFTDPLQCLAYLGDRAEVGAPPWALITDVSLPTMSGIAVVRILRKTEGLQDMRVVAVSGHFGSGGLIEDQFRGLGVELVAKGDIRALKGALDELVEAWRS